MTQVRRVPDTQMGRRNLPFIYLKKKLVIVLTNQNRKETDSKQLSQNNKIFIDRKFKLSLYIQINNDTLTFDFKEKIW